MIKPFNKTVAIVIIVPVMNGISVITLARYPTEIHIASDIVKDFISINFFIAYNSMEIRKLSPYIHF